MLTIKVSGKIENEKTSQKLFGYKIEILIKQTWFLRN